MYNLPFPKLCSLGYRHWYLQLQTHSSEFWYTGEDSPSVRLPVYGVWKWAEVPLGVRGKCCEQSWSFVCSNAATTLPCSFTPSFSVLKGQKESTSAVPETACYLCLFLLTSLCFTLIKPAFVIAAYTETCALAIASTFAVLLKVFYFWFLVWEWKVTIRVNWFCSFAVEIKVL